MKSSFTGMGERALDLEGSESLPSGLRVRSALVRPGQYPTGHVSFANAKEGLQPCRN